MALTLVTRLHALATNSTNLLVLAEHPEYLPCLVGMLTNEDPTVVKLSIETLFLISKCEEARPILANHSGLMPAIQQKLLSPNLETKRFALSIYGVLQQHYISATPSGSSGSSGAAQSKEAPKEAPTESVSYTIIISDSLDEDDRQILEDAVLQLKGVVSMFLNIYSRKCVVRTTSRPEPILAAICACGVSARLQTTSAVPIDKENSAATAAPGDKSWFGWGAQPNAQAIVKQGDVGGDPNGQGAGWFGRIAKSLWG
ncbi:MAG: hypothetical protein Q8P67_06190 [archaeon]|nr:hypothetical protein [archaeon]